MMSETEIIIGHLYPEHMDQFGDRGNTLALLQRARWHGLKPVPIQIRRGEKIDFDHVDLLVMGSTPQSEQETVVCGLKEQLSELTEAVEQGLVVLAIGGSYQILGKHYPADREKVSNGRGILDLHTEYSRPVYRKCGYFLPLWESPRKLVGFENHFGLPFLGPPVKPLGRIILGNGNNGCDRTEELFTKMVGTYLHGALLPKTLANRSSSGQSLAFRHRVFKPAPLMMTLKS